MNSENHLKEAWPTMSENASDTSFMSARSTPQSGMSSYASVVSLTDDDVSLPPVPLDASFGADLPQSSDEDGGDITPTPKSNVKPSFSSTITPPLISPAPHFGEDPTLADIGVNLQQEQPALPNLATESPARADQRSARQVSGYSTYNESAPLLSQRSGDISTSGHLTTSMQRYLLSSQLTAAPMQPVHPVQAPANDSAVPFYRSGFSKSQKLTLLLLCMTHFCLLVCYSLIAPFFPTEVIKKGSTATMSGIIFSCFQLAIVLAGPIFGSTVNLLGSKLVLVGGIFVVASTYIVFGFLDMFPLVPFIVLAFTLRVIEGFGSGAYQSAAFSICAATFGEDFAFAYGIMNGLLALGLTIGPVIGGVLYSVGGFGLPFWAFGSLFLVVDLTVWLFLPKSFTPRHTQRTGLIDSTASITAAEAHKGCGAIFRMLLVPGVLLDGLTQTASFFAIGFYQSVISLHVWPYVGGSELGVSLVILTSAAMEGLSSPAFGLLIRHGVSSKWIMLSGYALNVAGFMLMGPSPLFAPILKRTTLVTIVMGTLLHGLGCGAMGPVAVADIVKEAVRAGYPSNLNTYALCSGVSTSMMALGALFGPLAGGLMHDTIGFAWGATALAGLQVVLGTCFALNTVCRRNSAGRLRGYSEL